ICPGGIMSYTSTADAEGLDAATNYGAGTIDAEYFVTNQAYTNTVIQMGLYIDDDLANIVAGTRDANIAAIGGLAVNSNQTTLTFQAPPNRAAFVQQSSDLVKWTFPPCVMSTNST